MPALPHDGAARQNQFLAALPEADWRRLQPQLESVDLRFGQVLCESGSVPTHVYFPTTAVVSLLCLTMDGASSEIAAVGSEGVVGVAFFMGRSITPSRAVVHGAGQGYRLPAPVLHLELQTAGPVVSGLLNYFQLLIAQLTMTAACNRHHTIDQQFCRRLLQALDRSASGSVAMTQELMASLMGVRREGVTSAALKLQRAGVILYKRGRIEVLNRGNLETRACECYAAAKREHAHRLLPMAA